MLQTSKFVHKPLFVDAIQVTDANMVEVAKWCDGEIHSTSGPRKEDGYPAANYIKVKVVRPLNDRQCQAFVGDYVLKVGVSFKVFTAKAFSKSFNAVAEEPCGDTTRTADRQPCVLGKAHNTQEVIVGCRSLQDYLVLPTMVASAEISDSEQITADAVA